MVYYTVGKCQAGAQNSGGCIKQVMSLRLLYDYAVHKSGILYVVIDFNKTYNRVPQLKLIERLKAI